MRITSFILLQAPLSLDPQALAATLARLGWQAEATASANGQTSAVLSLGAQQPAIRSHMVMLMAQPFPFPTGELQPLLPFAWMWAEAGQTVAAQRAHLVVSTGTLADSLAARCQAAAVVLATVSTLVAGLPGAMGVLWDGFMLRPASFYSGGLAPAGALDHLSSHAVDHRLFRDDAEGNGQVGLSTRGLASFVGREVYLGGVLGIQPQGLIDLSLAMTRYLLDKGPVIRDRDTFDGPDGVLTARHEERGGTPVWRVARPAAMAPGPVAPSTVHPGPVQPGAGA